MAKDSFNRCRFSVPKADTSVNDWMSMQSNLSISLRMLIGEAIERDGYVDITCKRKEQLPKRGRPSKIEEDLPEDDTKVELTDNSHDEIIHNEEHSEELDFSDKSSEVPETVVEPEPIKKQSPLEHTSDYNPTKTDQSLNDTASRASNLLDSL